MNTAWGKIAAFHFLSLLPGGERLYRWTQKNVTHSIVPTAARVGSKMDIGLQYWSWLQSTGRSERVRGGTFLDFGSGWHPAVPLVFHSLGMERLHLLDIQRALDRDCLVDTIPIFREVATSRNLPFIRLPEPAAPGEPMEDICRRLGFQYHAPYGDLLERMSGTVDLATSTQVLLHIDRETLRHCFRALFGVLKPGGVFLGTIHLRDLFGGLNGQTSPYFNLQFSPAVWERWINSRMMGFNQLKAPDYRALLEEAGFRIAHFEVDPVPAEDLELLARTRVNPAFQHYRLEELAARHLFFAAEKPS